MLTTLSVIPLTLWAVATAQHVPNATIVDSNTALQLQVASSGGNATSPLQYGIMFEDINHSGDGGIYAEMIQNRAFQGSGIDYPSNLSSWGSIGGASLELVADPLSDALPNSMRVSASGSGTTTTSSGWNPWTSSQPAPANGSIGFYNVGYWGFSVKPQTYTGSFYVKGDYSGQFVASFASNTTGEVLTSVSITSESVPNAWTQHNFTLSPSSAASDVNNTFSITFDTSGLSDTSGLEFNLISVFPPTYKNRANGLRPDLMSALADLGTSFLRFPGGNNLEGNDPPYYWKWNETIGPLTDRPGRPGTWNYENTDGLGLVDYLNWCTDLSIEPILAVWSGLYLDGTIIPQAELQPYIDEALAMLEFIMGTPDTPMGALRVSLGYGSEPLAQINYVEVGNEDNLNGGEDSYTAYRYPMFQQAISAVYPNMNIIASTINITLSANDPTEMGDYHTYGRPDDLVLEFADFDQNTSAHKIFLGEYASIQENLAGDELAPVNWSAVKFQYPRWVGTVAEAIYLIGAERNSDAILGAGYAPTLQNVNSYEWAPDLISFSADPDETTLSTSYYMVQMMSTNRLSETLPVTEVQGGFGPAYYVAGKAADGRQMMKFAVYNSSTPVDFNVMFDGSSAGSSGQLTLLTGPQGPDGENAYGSGESAVTKTVSDVAAGSDGSYSFQVPELSVGIFAV